MPQFEGVYHEYMVKKTLADAHMMANHLGHDHAVVDHEKREQGTGNVRKRNWLHAIPRLWHRRKVYGHYLELRPPLWLGTDGVIYGEYEDLFGNSYFMEAEIWLQDTLHLMFIREALVDLDPCPDVMKLISL